MYKRQLVKLSMLTLTSGLILAACDDGGTENTPIEDESTEQTDQTEDTTDNENGTEITEEDSAVEDDSDTEPSETEEEAPDDSPGIETVEFEVSLFDAIAIFYDTFGSQDINIDEIEFDRDGNRYYYEIEGWDGEYEYDLDIDADTGDIIEQEMELDSDTDDILDLDGIITPQEAMSIALEAAGEGYVEEWELELENGLTVYEIDIVGARDHEVDAHSGEVWPD